MLDWMLSGEIFKISPEYGEVKQAAHEFGVGFVDVSLEVQEVAEKIVNYKWGLTRCSLEQRVRPFMLHHGACQTPNNLRRASRLGA